MLNFFLHLVFIFDAPKFCSSKYFLELPKLLIFPEFLKLGMDFRLCPFKGTAMCLIQYVVLLHFEVNVLNHIRGE